MQLNFNSISEAKPGRKWQSLFNTHWKAYKAWFESKGALDSPDLTRSLAQLRRYMPEMIPLYERLCHLAGDDPAAARFLTGYRPPAYISGCSQVVWKNEPQLVRNYDYHPHLSEGTLLHSAWNGRQVIATGDCLWGVVDGMNEDGLVASLTFGGRKVVGDGFGIPFLLRYVLEFCSDTRQAVEALLRVPTHMAYNVTVLDRDGNFKTVQLAPDRKPVVTDAAVATNHQGRVDWPEHAQFSRTLERASFLEETLAVSGQDADGVVDAFLKAPLFNRRYSDGFGTVYTAVYRPKKGVMQLRWPDDRLDQSFDNFTEGGTLVSYLDQAAAPVSVDVSFAPEAPAYAQSGEADYWMEYGKAWASGAPSDLAKQVAKTIADGMGLARHAEADRILQAFTSETKRRGQVPWEMLADVWAKIGRS